MRGTVMRASSFLFLCSLLLISTAAGFGQSGQQMPAPAGNVRLLPSWVLLERGQAELESRNYGQALFLFQTAIEKNARPFPEAEEALGDVYRQDGQPVLALKKYEKAYTERENLVSPDRRYALLMKMARLYLEQEDYRLAIGKLEAIAADDPHFAEARYENLRAAMERAFREKGLDALLRAYRVATPFALEAHAELGWLRYRLGQEGAAMRSLLLAVDGVVTLGMEELRQADPEYAFDSLSSFLRDCWARESTRQLLEDSGFFRTLYYLAASAQKAGFREAARGGWRVLASTAQAGRWAELAGRQLRSPWNEPVINPSSREIELPDTP